MKSKYAIIIFLLLIAFAPAAHARKDIVGETYGQVISAMSMNSPGVYGVSIHDLNSGDPTQYCDNNTQLCRLDGFSWSTVVGWTYWDGTDLQDELGAASFPDEYIAKVTYNGNMSGFIWGEKYGWIQLSSCVGLDNATCSLKTYCTWTGSNCEINKGSHLPDVTAQTDEDWGVYVDFCPLKPNQGACENVADNSDQFCNWDSLDNVCVFDGPNNANGQPLKGYAWSQYLGWIKFGPEAGEETDFMGAFTKWFPDLTPPTFEALNSDHAWIPNEDAGGTLSWFGFADENESLIDVTATGSKIMVNREDPTDATGNFSGCPSASAQPQGNLTLTQNGVGEILLTIPVIGKIGTPPFGFCQYNLGGVIYNGSGFGYYFGADGLAAATLDGLDLSSPPASYAPNVIDSNDVKLFVRAGAISPGDSLLAANNPGSIADGNDVIEVSFRPRDVGENPIVPVRTDIMGLSFPAADSNDWVRNLNLTFDLDQTSNFNFDSLSFFNPAPPPLILNGGTYLIGDPLIYSPVSADLAGDNLVSIFAYAPTSATNPLNMDEISATADDLELPALSQTHPAVPAGEYLTAFNSSQEPTGDQLPYQYSFDPALVVTTGDLDSDFIVLGQSVRADFRMHNNSSDPLSDYSVDNLLSFEDTAGAGESVLEINSLNLVGLNDPADRTDPDAAATRYQLLGAPGDNEFHNATMNYHDPMYSFNVFDADGLDLATGIYQVDGNYYVAPDAACRLDSSCTPKDIDRTDELGIGTMAAGGDGSFSYGFIPSQYIGEQTGAQVTFGIGQYLAYHASAVLNPFAQFAIYPATPYIDGVEVKSIGIGTTGVVSGSQVYESVSGRDLETISTASSADLRKEVRKNVASLTRNVVPCAVGQLDNFDTTASDCILVDETNKTIVAVYEGPGTLTLAQDGPISVPADYKYTLLLTNGADLYLANNVTYGAGTKNSLGIIVMQDDAGTGGNVYISPTPTNMVGLLYAEGSILSSPDAGATFYYNGANDPKELKNQLYWQGSIASRNSIGGAPNKAVPDGVDCDPWGDVSNCAQAFDLDYVRRFTTIHADPPASAAPIDFAPTNYLFSGGGECSPGLANNPGCTLGAWPTTITLKPGVPSDSIDVANSKSLATFFIERDNRPVPPGFTSGGGLTSSSEIR